MHSFEKPTVYGMIMNVIYDENNRYTFMMNTMNELSSRMTSAEISLTGKAQLNHTHTVADVVGLQAMLDSKVSSSHTYAVVDITGLAAALSGKADTSVTADLTTRMVAVESGPNSWTVWKSSKPAKIAQVTVTPTGGVVDILGIQVATGASITSLQSCFNTLKASHNAVLTLLSNREVQGA